MDIAVPGKVIAIASGGGHWVQLMRLRPALEGLDVTYVSLDPSAAADVAGHRYYTVTDFSRGRKSGFPKLVLQLLVILVRERPKVMITTGSAPALIGLMLGKRLFGAKTIWIDSIANVERMSTSGQKAGRFVDLWLTQWPDLAEGQGRRPEFWGAVL